MPIITTGPTAAGLGSTCTPWATIADLGSPCDDYTIDTSLLEDSLQIASDVLFHLSGQRFPGECEATIRPCGYRTPESCGCLSSRSCACSAVSELHLPGPVVSVDEVKIDGAVLDSARYRVDDYRMLVYLPESDSAERQGWPCCTRLDLADTEEDTWSITYTYGQNPPIGGIRAAAVLACELTLGVPAGDREPMPAPETSHQSITRQGVSMAILDPLTLFADGLTGLSEVDLWVSSVSVGAKRRRASVIVPGQPSHGIRRTNT